MIIGRVLAGIGIGVTSAIVPLYISEVATLQIYRIFCDCDYILYMSNVITPFWQISPTEIRGALGSINQLFICIGILVALVVGLPLSGNPLWY